MTCSSTQGMALYATDCSMEGGGVSQEAGLCGFPSSLLLLCRPEQSPWDFLYVSSKASGNHVLFS
jgi:hypothetical protein